MRRFERGLARQRDWNACVSSSANAFARAHSLASEEEDLFRRRLVYVKEENECPDSLLPGGYPIFNFVYLSSDDLPLFLTNAKIAPPAIKPPKTAKMTMSPQLSLVR